MLFSDDVIKALTGRTIARVEGTALHLDSGKAIYLEADEIQHLNEFFEDDLKSRKHYAQELGASPEDIQISTEIIDKRHPRKRFNLQKA